MRIAIIGGGAAGAAVALAAMRHSQPHDEVVVVERTARSLGRGVAYSTPSPRQLLNVPARDMSIFSDRPDHFVDFLRTRGEVHPANVYASRWDYGSYLEHTLHAEQLRSGKRLAVHRHEATDLRRRRDGRIDVGLTTGQKICADAVVLAVGHGRLAAHSSPKPPTPTTANSADRSSPMSLEQLSMTDVTASTEAIVIGSGLSAADAVLELATGVSSITVISQRRRFPTIQRDIPTAPTVGLIAERLHRADTAAAVVADARQLLSVDHGDWRAGADAIRLAIPAFWPRLCDSDKQWLLEHYQRPWELLRNRMPPATGRKLRQLTAAGIITFIAGRVHQSTATGVTVRSAQGEQYLHAEIVVACDGPSKYVSDMGEPLLLELLAARYVQPGPLGLGLSVEPSGRVRGPLRDALWAVGPVRCGEQWESFSLANIRTQAVEVATGIAGATSSRSAPS